MKISVFKILICISFLCNFPREIIAQDSVRLPWTAGLYFLGTTGIPKTAFRFLYKYNNSSAIGFGFGMHISKKSFGLKTEFENVFYNGDYIVYNHAHEVISEKSLYSKNYFFKILVEYRFNNSGPGFFFNMGPAIHFQEEEESLISLLHKGIGPEMNLGISPQLGRVNFLISTGIIYTSMPSSIDLDDLIFYKLNFGLKFNFN